jgi:cell division protein FtsB
MPKSTRDESKVASLPAKRRQNPWLWRALVFITCVLLAESLLGDRGLAQTIRARRAYRASETAVAKLRNENAGLREQIRRLRSDPREIEAVARRELGLIRPGEVLFLIRDVK